MEFQWKIYCVVEWYLSARARNADFVYACCSEIGFLGFLVVSDETFACIDIVKWDLYVYILRYNANGLCIDFVICNWCLNESCCDW